MKPASAKAKGRIFQQWVGSEIGKLIGLEYGTDLDISSRPMGQSGTDIILSKDAVKLFPFAVECKCQESWSITSWITQARKNVKNGLDWILFGKKNHFKPVVILDAEVFFKIYRVYLNAKSNSTKKN